jgi:hypothetical protein
MKLQTLLHLLRDGGPLLVAERTVARIRESTYVWNRRRFGWREAILFPDGYHIDLWTRYSRTAEAIADRLPSNGLPWSMLEVGSGGPGLCGFMRDHGFWRRLRPSIADYDLELLRAGRHPPAVVADVTQLPFPDRTFDVVLAVDLLEHLSPEARGRAAAEMRRLARRLIVCHCPAQGEEEGFEGRSTDQQFDREYRRLYRKKPPRWTRDHIEAGHPSAEELRRLFPGCSLSGDQNCEVWLQYMLAGEPGNGRMTRLLTGWRYRRRWSRLDGRPPFRSALVVYDAPGVDAGIRIR